MSKKPLAANALMRHLRSKNVSIRGSKSKNDLINYGYFHAYKGYRFVRKDVNLPIATFGEIVALVDFDNDLKSLLFPSLSFIETAIKNRAVSIMQSHCKSIDVNTAFLFAFNRYQKMEVKKRNEEIRERLSLQTMMYERVRRELKDNPIISHFAQKYDHVPLYAVAEIVDLGTLGLMLRCSNDFIRNKLSDELGIPKSRDQNREMVYKVVYALKDLRNAIAHNSPVFDCRFHKFALPQSCLSLVGTETKIAGITMNKLTDYLVLVVFLLKHLGRSKTEMAKLIKSFQKIYDTLCERVSPSLVSLVFVYSVSTQLSLLKNYAKQ